MVTSILALAVAKQLHAYDVRTVWLGSKQGLENRIVPQHGIKLIRIFISGLRGRGVLRWLAAPFVVLVALFQSLCALWAERPGAVLGMGGFASGPGGIAAWLCRTPLVIHEQNARAGSTNKILCKFATQVFQAFPNTFDIPGVTTVGNPVRAEIAALCELPIPELSDSKINLLILGGSRGARYLNTHIPEVLSALANDEGLPRMRVKHQCGDAEFEATRALYARDDEDVEVIAFIDDMATAYGWADVVICRAGAMTISELAAAGRAAVLVPFPYATDDHQTLNAKYLAENGAAVLMPQGDDFDDRLSTVLRELLVNKREIIEMSTRARSLAITDAAETVAKRCRELAGV